MGDPWRSLKSNRLLFSFSILGTGSVLSQIITIFVAPITTRLFSPEDFGIYTLIATAVGIFGPVTCLKYDMAIVTAETEQDVLALVKLCILICFPLSLCLGLLYGFIVLSKGYSGVTLFLFICAIVVLLINVGINNILIAHNTRNSLYKLIASVSVLRSMANNSLLLIGGFFHTGAPGIIVSSIISSYAGLARQSMDLRPRMKLIVGINGRKLVDSFVRNINQPLYNTTAALVTTSAYSIINLFINFTYSVQQLGLYSLSYRVLGIPFSIISANVARVFFNTAAEEVKQCGNYHITYKRTLRLLVFIIVPIIALMALTAPGIFSFAFGEEWREAGDYVRILAPMFGIRLVTESLTTSFIVSSKQHLELGFQSTLLIGELLLFIGAYVQKASIESFLFWLSLLYLAIYVVMLVVMNELSKTKTA